MTDEPAAAADPAGAKMISPEVFNSLLNECGAASAEVAEINGETRERIGHHVENSNLNARAFGWMRIIDRMGQKRTHDAQTLITVAMYYLGLMQNRLRRQHELALDLAGQSDAASEEAADEQAAAANAEALSGIKPTSAADMQREHELKKEKRKLAEQTVAGNA